MPLSITVVPAQIIPDITPYGFEKGMLAGESYTQSITIANAGFAPWKGVTVTTPTLSWVKLQGPGELGDIAPGGNVTITMLLTPGSELITGRYPQNPLIKLKSSNYADVAINAGLTVTSQNTGEAQFTVTNADKKMTDADRFISGAALTLTSLDVSGLTYTAKADTNGLARLDTVAAGRYAWRIEAGGFQTASGNMRVEPGVTVSSTVYLPTSMVTYKWSVTPTTITDKYDITLDMTYRTDVPAPALVMDPVSIDLNMTDGQTMNTQFTIKNKGLVAAHNLQIYQGTTDEAVTMTFGITEIAELGAGQSVVVPVRLTLAHTSCHSVTVGAKYNYACAAGIESEGSVQGLSITLGDGNCGGGGVGGGSTGGQVVVFGGTATKYVAKSVIGAAVSNMCGSSGAETKTKTYHRKCYTCKLISLIKMLLPHGSLGIEAGILYDPEHNKFYDPNGWQLEEQPDGSLLLTDDEGNQVLYVIVPGTDPEISGGCGQYEDIPGYNAIITYSNGEYTLARKDGTDIKFSKQNGVLKPYLMKDRNDTTLTYAYDSAGNMTRITDIHGRYMNFSYDNAKHVTGISDFTGRSLAITYNSDGLVQSATDLDGTVTTYGYDSAKRMSQINYANGAHKYMVYDSSGRVSGMYGDDDVGRNDYVYNDISSTTLVTDALKHSTLYTEAAVAGRSEVTAIEDAAGGVTTYGYDWNFNRTSVTDPLNRTTRMTYGRFGNLLSVTDAAGNTTRMTYGPGSASGGNVLAVNNSFAGFRNNEAQNNCPVERSGSIGVVGVSAASDLPGYSVANDAPYLTQVTDAKGNTTDMDYDLSGNITKVTDAMGNTTEMSYDGQGHVTGTKDALNNVSAFAYDNFGSLNKVTDPLGRITTLTRDNRGNVTQTKDPIGNITVFSYDVKNNLTQVLDAIGGVTKYTYTSGGGCTSCGSSGDLLGTVTDAKNQTTTFNYDKHQRLTSVVNPVGNTKTFEYDKKNNLTKVTDAKGQVITFDYDVKDRLIKKHLPEGNVIYTYDGADNLLSVTSPDSAISMSYGILNQVIETKQTVGGITYTIDYTYDVNQNRTSMTSPWGTTYYTYDNLNRLVSITNPDNKTITFAYDALGRRTTMTYPNGIETTYAYDAASQLTQILARKTADNSVIAYNNYSYDNAGNRTQMQDLTGTHTYGYDDLYRLIIAEHPATSALPTKTETFTYDKVGNRTSDAVMTNYQYNTANRLLSNSSYTYTYDANGNQISKTESGVGTTEYNYTSENQLKQAELPNGTKATYKYDAIGRRISKTVNGVITYYVYDNEDIITMLDSSNTVTANFTHGPGIDEPLILSKPVTVANYYYHADGLGSIKALSDDNSVTIETIEYQAYGKPIIKDASGNTLTTSAIGNPYMFTAREYDAETGNYYYRERDLDPSIGAFTEEDPITFYTNRLEVQWHNNIGVIWQNTTRYTPDYIRMGILSPNNVYAYALNRPTAYTDPNGELVPQVILLGLASYILYYEYLHPLFLEWWFKQHPELRPKHENEHCGQPHTPEKEPMDELLEWLKLSGNTPVRYPPRTGR